jgi:hypothetical protein
VVDETRFPLPTHCQLSDSADKCRFNDHFVHFQVIFLC